MPKTSIKILLVEDNPGDVRLLLECFRQLDFFDAKLTHVISMAEAEKHVANDEINLILLDLHLPDADGIASVRRVRETAPHVPVVVLTSFDNEALALRALQEGVQDYLIKGQFEPPGLVRALSYAIEREAYQKVLRRQKLELEQQKRELERSNADLEQFAFAASHDLQEPLRMVIGYVRLLSTRYMGKLDPAADEFITRAVDGAGRMQRLVRNVLAYSRVGSQGVELLDVSSDRAMRQALINLQDAIEQSGALVTHDPLPNVLGDETQLVQLFQNLIGNAIKYQKDGEIPLIHVSSTGSAGDGWTFTVRDNGIGISPEYFEKIFSMFQRLHTWETFTGSGMGLAICKKIVERHGGGITVDSRSGHGSSFQFTLKSSENNVAPADPTIVPATRDLAFLDEPGLSPIDPPVKPTGADGTTH
jgi:signal transduction histidine kinase